MRARAFLGERRAGERERESEVWDRWEKRKVVGLTFVCFSIICVKLLYYPSLSGPGSSWKVLVS